MGERKWKVTVYETRVATTVCVARTLAAAIEGACRYVHPDSYTEVRDACEENGARIKYSRTAVCVGWQNGGRTLGLDICRTREPSSLTYTDHTKAA